MIDLELDRRIPVPLYYQLQQQLRQAILDGRMTAGSSLPPEPDLAVSAGVSRFTVRQAVEQLVREGLVRRERGRGTFVADLEDGSGAVQGFQFNHGVDRPAGDVTIRVERSQSVSPPDAMRQILPPNAADTVLEIVRVYESGQKPVAVETIYLSSGLVPDPDAIDFSALRLVPYIEQQLGLRVSHAEENLRAECAGTDVAALLGLAEGAPVFRIDRRSWAGTSLLEMSTVTVPGQVPLSRILDSSAHFTAI